MQPCGVWKTTQVPANKVDQVIAGYQLDNPIKIDKIKIDEDTFDIVATFPPCTNGRTTNQPRD